jgi:hypothetical protein
VIFDYTSSQGLKKYFLGFIEPHNIKIKEISCNMHKRSRAGYFLFEITDEEFTKLTKVIELREYNIFTENDNATHVNVKFEIKNVIRRCDMVEGFQFKNPQYEKKYFIRTMTSPFLPEVKVYIADPPLPIISSKSCGFIVYNSSTKQCCVLLKYLFG